ncbi:Ion channel [Bhargavaea beijingensis]|uniref:Ion channel n=2 Tax=Bhargavaea beijingensis TaxID=426756 RepID=A0A1G7B6L4_9BACL|nr:Ion channel [Bhargavaea beijingensis]
MVGGSKPINSKTKKIHLKTSFEQPKLGLFFNKYLWGENMISLLLTMKRLLGAILKNMKDPVFKSLVTTLTLILLSGTLFYRGIEGWSWLDSFYFAVISLMPTSASTGLVPSMTISKVFTMIYLVVGIGVMVGALAMIGKSVLKFDDKEMKRSKKKPNN